jgi:hypothetical protein
VAYLNYQVCRDGLKSILASDALLTETIQRIGVLDPSSITERTIPVTGNPFNINVAFSPRYWAFRKLSGKR